MKRLYVRMVLSLMALGWTGCSAGPRPRELGRKPVTAELSKAGWYVAAEKPLTFCPTGHSLPAAETMSIASGEWVYLHDKQTRFWIPRGKDSQTYCKQAMAVRTAALTSGEMNQEHAQASKDRAKTVLKFLTLIGSLGTAAPFEYSREIMEAEAVSKPPR